jgi:thioredoxin reductase (NADPH)
MEKFDLIIVGAGPAGLTAGLYAIRTGLKVAIISKDIGGTTNSILLLENWPGFSGSGTELMKKFYDQLKEYEGVEFIMSDVENIDKKNDLFIVKTKKDEFQSEAIILATGTERRKLNVPGEKEFTGKGVSYCVTCDAFFFKGKTVGVVGGSDCAAVSALALSDLAKKVYIIYRGEKLRCEDINSKRLEEKENVEIVYNTMPKEIKGDKKVTSFVGIEKGKEREIELDGVFIEIGSVPLTKFTKNLGLKLDKEGYIIVEENMNTSVKGVYAAGDITHQKLKQVVVASSDGAIAAKSAYDYLKK